MIDPKEESKRRRARNREGSAEMLTGAGIAFESRNEGAHLIVAGTDGFIDFWPGTGLWIPRYSSGRRRRGVRALLRELGHGTTPHGKDCTS